ncbi:MAG: HlyC/CorC family transporter [Chloroflexi bacterium]|nr:MAG: HlyC/CorC family transporter [Chloroflexota bacterium]
MTLFEVLLLVGLITVNAILSMARVALINVRKQRLRQLVEDGVASARIAEKLAEDASRLLATTQLALVLTSSFASAVVAVTTTPPLAALVAPWLGAASYPAAFVLVVFVAALAMLILAQLVPEALGLHHSERLALALARPLNLLATLAMPVVHLVVWISGAIARLFGAGTRSEMPFVTEEEIRTLVDAGEEEGVLEEEEKEMIYSIFDLGDTMTREVMVPRIDVVALEVTTPLLEALETIMQAGHSRIPVFYETIDNVEGVLYAKDLLPYLRDGHTDVPLKDLLRQAYFVPETKKASELLPDLQQRRVHMAIVVDEYGGVAGLVTIEDLLEEIVGEIQDEYDTEEPFVEFVDENEYVFDARVDLDDLNRLMDVSLPTEDNDTLGGFIYTELGKVPTPGDQVAFGNMEFVVESVAGRRIRKVRVRRQLPPSVQQPPSAGEGDSPAEKQANGNGNGKRRWTP